MIKAIVLAAGLSRRMGTDKLLLPYGGTTVIGRVLGELSASEVGGIVVVTGPGGEAAGEAARAGAAVVVNAEEGGPMISSLRAGLRSLEPCDGVLVALGDQPSITRGLVDAMIGRFDAAGGGIVVPVFGGRRGHPLLFGAGYSSEIMHCYDDTGLRGLPAAHPDEVVELRVATDAVLSDIDTPEDYRREVARLKRESKA